MAETSVLKTAALCWLRYGKRLPIVATEVGRWSADVIGMSATQAIEVEVKRSKADLRAEFRNKQTKHYLYANAKETSIHVPNFLYFLVPSFLEDYAVKVVKDNAPKAGVLSYDTEKSPGDRDAVRVVTRPTRLKEEAPSKVFLTMAMMRCSSEVCGLHRYLDELSAKVVSSLDEGRDQAIRLVARDAGTLDVEAPVDDHELRAQELAYCVENIGPEEWAALPLEQRKKWLEASVRLLDANYVQAKGWIAQPFLF